MKSGLLIAMITLTMSFFIVYTVFENSMTLTIIMIVYLTINTVYSFFNLKRLNLVGISLVASGFPLRFAFGTYAIEAEFSYWAVLLSFTLAMFLLSGKRVQQGTDTNSRSIILDYRYSTLLLFGGLFGAEYVSFIADSNNQDFWGNTFFFISPIPVFLMVARYLELVAASRITDDEDITESFMKDLQLFVTAISYAFIMFAARYSS